MDVEVVRSAAPIVMTTVGPPVGRGEIGGPAGGVDLPTSTVGG